MSEIKPVYQTVFIATEFPDGWHEVDKQVHDVRANHPDQFKTRILYPAAAYEALQKENAELRHVNLTSLADLHFKNRELESKNAALQKENAELKRNHKFTCENLANTVPFIEELEQKNEALRKRLNDLEQMRGKISAAIIKGMAEISGTPIKEH